MRLTRGPTRGLAIRRCFIATAPIGKASGRAAISTGSAATCMPTPSPAMRRSTEPMARSPPRITHVACMAHARRKFFEVFEATKSPIAEEALRRIQELYAIEADIKGRPADQRWTAAADAQQAAARCIPRLGDGAATTAVRQRRRSAKPSSTALSRWDALTRYIEDGRLSIDNNLAERLLRGIAVSRKNFLFLGSDSGGDRAAAILHHHRDRKAERPRSRGLSRQRARSPGARSSQQPPRRTAALELPCHHWQ